MAEVKEDTETMAEFMDKLIELVQMQSPRMRIRPKLFNLIEEEKREVFQLFNFVLFSTDNLVDGNKKEAVAYLKLADLMKNAWKGEEVYGIDDYESSAIELISELKRLKKEGVNQADYIVMDIQELFYGGFKDASRRWRILGINELQKIRIGCSKGYAAIYLHLLFPGLERKYIEELSLKCGLAAKTADDIIDWSDDVLRGFINIPKEDIKNLHGITIRNDYVKHVDKEKLSLENGYIKREIEKINDLYREADNLLEEVVPKNTARQAFKEFMYSWLLESKEKYM